MLMSSAAVAVTLSAWRRQSVWKWAFALITIVFGYTTVANIFERPDGIKIASFFIVAIVVASFISRALRSTEVRIEQIELVKSGTFVKTHHRSDSIVPIAGTGTFVIPPQEQKNGRHHILRPSSYIL